MRDIDQMMKALKDYETTIGRRFQEWGSQELWGFYELLVARGLR
jgi:hypothetical protein